MAVEREVADADVGQVLQAGTDFVQQQLQGFGVGFGLSGRTRHPRTQRIKKAPQLIERHQHQVMQAQPRKRLQLFTCPLNPLRHEALGRRQHRIRLRFCPDTPQQTFGLQARPGTGGAFGVAAVLGQQHPDVHLVSLALQVLKKPPHAIPVLVPLAVPVGRAVDDPVLLLGRELVPGRIARNACAFCVAHQVVLAFGPGGCLHGLNGSSAQGELVVGDDQAHVHPHHPAKATAGLASPHGRIEGKQRSNRVLVADIALGAMQACGEAPSDQLHICYIFSSTIISIYGGYNLILHIDIEPATAAFDRHLDGLQRTRLLHGGDAKAIGHHVQHFSGAAWGFDLALGVHACEAAGRQPLGHLLGGSAGWQLHREGQHQARIRCGLHAPHCVGFAAFRWGLACTAQQLGVDGFGRVVLYRQCGLPVKQVAGTREQEFEMIVQLRHGAHGGAAGTHRVGLVDGDGRGHALYLVHSGLVHAVQELAGIGTEGFHVAALAFGVQGVEHQAGLARAAGARHHRQLAGADVQVQVLQIVLACAADADDSLGHGVVVLQ